MLNYKFKASSSTVNIINGFADIACPHRPDSFSLTNLLFFIVIAVKIMLILTSCHNYFYFNVNKSRRHTTHYKSLRLRTSCLCYHVPKCTYSLFHVYSLLWKKSTLSLITKKILVFVFNIYKALGTSRSLRLRFFSEGYTNTLHNKLSVTSKISIMMMTLKTTLIKLESMQISSELSV